MMAVQESFLRCTACEQEAEHQVVYAGRFVSEIQCTGCGAVTRLDVSEDYLPDLRQRISSKPGRLVRRLRTDPGELASSLPVRTLSKPVRMLQEFRAVWRSRS
ncbi:hypothetical protein M3C58_04920 [Brachybacterium muris]|nr:hypothetical protein [Brachybacterium muris]MCT1997546.1 hypothetical protein [Brachybacterium muris]MCT2177729.1 hypothetical protein [Brachybacterium muris]MCT2260860.1 hypothetical protein [Brachybacterium muris]